MQTITTPTRAEFLRFPRNGSRCEVTGLSRPFLYDLATRGEIKTVSLRQRNKARGVRLIVADSLIEWIKAHAEPVEAPR